jgi:5-oxoprolinase (ATP-hydrolysing)
VHDSVGPPAGTPFGPAGGEPGQVGENWVRRKDGRRERLQGCDATTMEAGDAITIQTPTAGGYGEPAK